MILMPNKITNRLNIKLLITIIFSTTSLPVLYAQKNSEPQVIREYSLYKRSLKDDSLKKMVSSRWKRNGGIFSGTTQISNCSLLILKSSKNYKLINCVKFYSSR